LEAYAPIPFALPRYPPSDAPLQASIFVYEVSVRVDDSIVVARYESEIGNLLPGNSVKIRLEDHRMYFKEPSSEDFEFTIVSHRRFRGKHTQNGSTQHFQNCSFTPDGNLSARAMSRA
jgi:hypothetical protein